MDSHTPAPPRMRPRRRRPNQVVITAEGEDYPEEAPTVMAADLQELGIEPDSLAIDPSRARRMLRDRRAPHARPPVRSRMRRGGQLRVEAPAPAPRVAPPSRPVERTRRMSTEELRKQRHVDVLTGITIAAVPVLLALLTALWLTFG